MGETIDMKCLKKKGRGLGERKSRKEGRRVARVLFRF